ncbi:MAG: hypothetical protein ABIF19_05535 [Planctomycetota bacterium]
MPTSPPGDGPLGDGLGHNNLLRKYIYRPDIGCAASMGRLWAVSARITGEKILFLALV